MSGRAYPGGHFNISAFRITHYKPPLLFQNLVPLLLGTTLPRSTLLRELYNLELWRALCLHFATVVCATHTTGAYYNHIDFHPLDTIYVSNQIRLKTYSELVYRWNLIRISFYPFNINRYYIGNINYTENWCSRWTYVGVVNKI